MFSFDDEIFDKIFVCYCSLTLFEMILDYNLNILNQPVSLSLLVNISIISFNIVWDIWLYYVLTCFDLKRRLTCSWNVECFSNVSLIWLSYLLCYKWYLLVNRPFLEELNSAIEDDQSKDHHFLYTDRHAPFMQHYSDILCSIVYALTVPLWRWLRLALLNKTAKLSPMHTCNCGYQNK